MVPRGLMTRRSSLEVLRGRHLDDDVDAVGRQVADGVGGVALAVVHRVVRTGCGREPRLVVAADGGDDGRARPPRELDGGVADRARAAGDEHRPAGQGTRGEPVGPVLGGGQGTVGGDRRDAERGAHVVRRPLGQLGQVADGEHDELLRGAAGAPVLRQHRPDPVAHREPVDVGSDGVDDTGAVLAGHDLGEGELAHAAGAELPVGRVDAGADDPYPDLARARVGRLALDHLEDRAVACLGVDHGTHRASPSSGTCGVPQRTHPADYAARVRSSSEAPLEVGGVRLPRPQRRRRPLGPVGRVGEQLRLERDAVALAVAAAAGRAAGAVEEVAGVDLQARLVGPQLDGSARPRGRRAPQRGAGRCRGRRSCGRCRGRRPPAGARCAAPDRSLLALRKSKGVPSTGLWPPVGMPVPSIGVNVVGLDEQLVAVDRPGTLAVEVEVGVVGQVDHGGGVGGRLHRDPDGCPSPPGSGPWRSRRPGTPGRRPGSPATAPARRRRATRRPTVVRRTPPVRRAGCCPGRGCAPRRPGRRA